MHSVDSIPPQYKRAVERTANEILEYSLGYKCILWEGLLKAAGTSLAVGSLMRVSDHSSSCIMRINRRTNDML